MTSPRSIAVRKFVAGLYFVSAAHVAMCSTGMADSNVVTPAVDGASAISCYCILANSTCQSALLNSISGQGGTWSWSQENYFKTGVKVDLSIACWRKRSSEGLGNGLCCSNNNNESDVRFFWGEVAP